MSQATKANVVVVEDKGLRFHISIRVYGRSTSMNQSHSYCVDDTPCGVSPPIGTLYVDIRSVNLKQMKQMIQYNKTNHMDRRSLMFQEAIFIMQRLPNVFNRPKADMLRFQFGFYNRETRKTMFVNVACEELPLCKVINAAGLQVNDLVIVPLSQIPEDALPQDDMFVLSPEEELDKEVQAQIEANESLLS